MAIIRRNRDEDDARAYTPRPQLAAPGAASGLMRKQRVARPEPEPVQAQPEIVPQRITYDRAALDRPFTLDRGDERDDRAPATAGDLTDAHLGTMVALTVHEGRAPIAGVLRGVEAGDTGVVVTIGQAPGADVALPDAVLVVGTGAAVEVAEMVGVG